MVVELSALNRGLNLCIEKGLSKVWIEVDALCVIQLLFSKFKATLKEESPDNVQREDGAPPLIKRVLEENQDVMPPQLPAKLPPRREVDHVIELEPAPLTDLLKKNKPWVWSEACQLAFEDLKAATQKKLSPKQARWQDFLAEFDYVLEYKPGKANVVADALSRKAELAAISLAKGNVHEKIKEGLEHDPMAKELMRLAKEGKTRQFWVEDGLLYTKGRRLYVPKWGNLRKDLIKECHDTKWAGHPGQKRTMADCTAEEAARAFFKNVVKYWGLPKSIISDRDPRFTGRLWTELFKLLGSELSEATGKSPFELATGQQPLTPHTLAISFDSARCPGAAKMAKSWAEQSDLAKSFLEKARRKMKKWADPKRRHLEFNTGDKVLIKLIPQQFKAFRGMHKGLVRKYEGPYPVVAKVGKVSYRLDLPSTLKIHPVFHVSMLRPYQEDEEDPSRGESHRAPPVVTKSFDKEIEEVLSHKVVRRRGVKPTTHYFIKWKGLPESEATWESQDDLWQRTRNLLSPNTGDNSSKGLIQRTTRADAANST
ncbi:hypothetical protein BUALT_Bualt03G0164900 [Buddleja alternifolia]|uniref:Chromo domain-containing protein n=1 Tax=Buddleja alternifolia TaxID=168488 RepID=A0AAV6XW15_9LAMI|nr:hypothetical protein BUALT_Bualt03G0164900 [Buddleja alternifolia]